MSGFKLIDYSQRNDLQAKKIPILNKQDIRSTLERFQQQEPRFVELISPAGDSLAIGVSRSLGCVMFTRESGNPPYLWALGNSNDRVNALEFDAGGTATSVPLARCLPFEQVVDIVVYFYLNGELPQNIEWDED